MKKLVFTFIPVLFFLGSAEMLVRLTGAAETCPSASKSPIWVCDPLLYFKNNPELVVHGKPLNRAGFRGREFLAKEPGVFRILSLGDSCTFGIAPVDQGLVLREPYPQLLERSMRLARGPGRVEVLNAGSPGYNSYQGLLLLRTKLRGLAPDLITVRFGWNDHLMSKMGREQGAFRESPNPIARAFNRVVLRTALYPFGIRLLLEARERFETDRDPTPSFPGEWKPNMSIAEYRAAMQNIAALGSSLGARVWFLTPPQALASDENLARYEALSIHADARKPLFFNGMRSFARMRDIHNSYIEATRELARELDVPLVDMDALYRDANDEHLFSIADVIHPTNRGQQLEASALHQRLLASGILDDPL